MKINKLIGLAILALSISMVSCSGEDGQDGINGINGIDGQDGADGQDGQNGENGEGFDEMSQFGSISLNLSGTRPDGEAFEDSAVFKFAGLDGDFPEGGGNTMIIQEGQDFTTYPFRIFRFLTTPDDDVNKSFTGLSLVFSNLGEADESLLFGEFILNKYTVKGDDYKYFVMTDSYQSGANGTSEFEFTDLTFDAEDNNHLSFSYSFMVAANTNSSEHELAVSGEVDVYILEKIQ